MGNIDTLLALLFDWCPIPTKSLQERRNRKSRTASMEIVEATEVESAETSKRPGHSQNHTTKPEKKTHE